MILKMNITKQGVSGFLFAFLPYTGHVGWFIGLSYLLRFMEGVGTAMAWSSSLGILMKIFPNKVSYFYLSVNLTNPKDGLSETLKSAPNI